MRIAELMQADLVLKAKTVNGLTERTKLYPQAPVNFKEPALCYTIAHSVQIKPMQKSVIDVKNSPFGRHNFYGVDIKK